MEGPSFASAVSGQPSGEAARLVFLECYHACFENMDQALPFIKKAQRKSGKPAFYLTENESLKLVESCRFTLIGKFSARQPKLELIKRHFELMKLKGSWNVGSLDSRHIMIKLSMEEDYALLFSKKMHMIENILIRFLKWTQDFDFKSEPPIAPIWIRFPGLKLHLFHKQFLFSLATAFGKPLKLDLQTFNLSRPSMARVLVEMDITCPQAEEIWIGTQTVGYWQRVEIDSKPLYCSHCRIFGHCLENFLFTKPYMRPERFNKMLNEGLTTGNLTVADGVRERFDMVNNVDDNAGRNLPVQNPIEAVNSDERIHLLEEAAQILADALPSTQVGVLGRVTGWGVPVTGFCLPVDSGGVELPGEPRGDGRPELKMDGVPVGNVDRGESIVAEALPIKDSTDFLKKIGNFHGDPLLECPEPAIEFSSGEES